MKKQIYVVLMLVLILSFTFACSKPESTDLELGKYVSNTPSDISVPFVELQEDNKFVFEYSALSSYLPVGTYEIKDSQLILKADDHKYMFDIKKGKLVFKEKDSTPLALSDVKDGTVFEKQK